MRQHLKLSNTSSSIIDFDHDTIDFSVTSEKIESHATSNVKKFISFKSQLVTNNIDKLQTAMKNLDTLKVDPGTLINNLTLDIIIVILYLTAFISHILSLILLYSNNNTQSMFYISLSLLIVGSLINCVWAFFYGVEIMYEHTSNKTYRILGVA
eukprot:495043_1